MAISIRKLSVAAIILLTVFVVAPANAQTFVVKVDGETYVLTTTARTSYDSESELLQSQPWWGNPALAEAIVAQMQYNLGDYYGGDSTSSPSALLAYGLSGDYVSIVYWSNEVINCPSGCPAVGDAYVYVLGQEQDTQGIPANSLWSLMMMCALFGWIGWRRLSSSA